MLRPYMLLVACLSVGLASGSVAAAPIGKIASYAGTVTVHPDGAVRGRTVRDRGEELIVGDHVRTRSASQAMIELIDGSRIMLQPDSTLRLIGAAELEPKTGRILFDIRTQGRVSGLLVQTPTAVLGVKGTQFVVEPGEQGARVFLREGELAISAKQGSFRMGKPARAGRPAPDPRIEALKQRLDRELAEAVAEFSLEAGEAVEIKGQSVAPIGFSKAADDSFEAFEAWLLDDSDLDDFPELDIGKPR